MKIKYEAVHPVRVHAICDCGGEHRSTGRDDMTHNKKGHRCTGCGKESLMDTAFPAIEHFTEAEMKVLIAQG